MDEKKHIEIQSKQDNTSQYSEIYSNDKTEDIQIYSNDNEDDHDTSVLESVSIETQNELSELLKNNKLQELQEIARGKNISIYRENSLKKKIKLELANDILKV